MAAAENKLGFQGTWSMAVGGMVGGGIFAIGRYRMNQERSETLANLQSQPAARGALVATVVVRVASVRTSKSKPLYRRSRPKCR